LFSLVNQGQGVKVQVLLQIFNDFFRLALHVLSEAVDLRARNIVGLAVSPNLLNISKDLLKVLVFTFLDIFLLSS
jgi:hypothetical protein